MGKKSGGQTRAAGTARFALRRSSGSQVKKTASRSSKAPTGNQVSGKSARGSANARGPLPRRAGDIRTARKRPR